MEIKYYVYYDYGRCDQGDHCCGLESFSKLKDATQRYKDVEKAMCGDGILAFYKAVELVNKSRRKP